MCACRSLRLVLRKNRSPFADCLRFKSYYITTPIFYVNSQPHLGHLYTASLADARQRWERLKKQGGQSAGVVSATGTDEHGQKIYEAASKTGMQTLQFCDKVSERFKDLYKICGIEYTDFIRTTEERHKDAVHAFWNLLEQRGFIYKGSYEGWYSTQDEAFVSEKDTEEVKGDRISIESGHKVEWMKEDNYLFRLSAVIGDVRSWLEKNPSCIYPSKFRNALLKSLDFHTKDISISREKRRVPWGIETPSDPTQTVYVWLDALINYLTVAGFPDVESERFKNTWPADCHIIGRDILKFHAVYWPAFLIAAGLDLPRQIVVHSHWLMERRKMSKSIGNVVDPFKVAESVGGERMKYFLLKQGVLEHDCDFSQHLLLQAANGDISNTLGNCLNRSVAPKLCPNQVYPPFHKNSYERLITSSDPNEESKPVDLIELVRQLPGEVERNCGDFHFYKALEDIMECVREANALIHRNKIWNLDVSKPEDKKLCETAVHCAYETLRVCAILLLPFTPQIAAKVLDRLNVNKVERTLSNAANSFYGATGLSLNCPMTGRELGPNSGILAPNVKSADLKLK